MKRKRILIVDDEADARALLTMALRAEDIEVIEAGDGLTALRLAYERRPDLIILDIAMPLMDGWLTCQRIREVWDTPIIMVTASSELEARVRGLELGADDYLAKPYDIDELQLRVRAVMKRAQDSSLPHRLHARSSSGTGVVVSILVQVTSSFVRPW